MAEFRILKNNAARVARTFYKADGETPADATPQTTGVTYGISAIDGTVITAAGVTATYLAAAGQYAAPIPAQTRLNRLVVTWTATTVSDNPGLVTAVDYVDVKEAFFFELAELRAMDGLADTAKYTSAMLADARRASEYLIENYTQVAWTPAFEREVLDGLDYTLLEGRYRGVDYKALGSGATIELKRVPCLTKHLIQVSIAGTVQDISTWTLSEWGRLSTGGTVFPPATAGQNVDVQYEHGYYAPPPDLKRAAMRLARHTLLTQNSSIPDRARLMTTEFATFQLTIASEDFPTGLPEVDAVLQNHREWVPRFA